MRKVFLTAATVGLVFAMAGRASALNIVLNPGFETGDLTDWTQSGNTSFTGVTDVSTFCPQRHVWSFRRSD